MSKNHQIHSSELDSPKNLMQYNYKIVPDLRSLKHTHTHTHTHTHKCKDSIIKTQQETSGTKYQKNYGPFFVAINKLLGNQPKYMREWTTSYTRNVIPVQIQEKIFK